MNLFERYREEAKKRCRIRELGFTIGEFSPGPLNAITDVKGVRVGHTTLIEGSGRRKPGNGPVRTGVTVIIPNEDIYNNKLIGAGFILNGAGEIAGYTQMAEWGILETPIALTNTHSVGRVSDSVIKWMAQKYPEIGQQQDVIIPVVGECDDSFLNDAVGLHIKPHHVFNALDSAKTDSVEEGAVGAGTGMICCDFKAGIGMSSRIIPIGEERYTVGALVLSNFGVMENLRVDGYPIGKVLARTQKSDARRTSSYGSIIVVVATDMPLSSLQVNRLCKRAALGIGRAGTYAANSSGEIIIGFSTANHIPRQPKASHMAVRTVLDMFLDPAYQGVIEVTEEAILNSLTTSVDMEGAGGNRVPAINLQLLKSLLEHYNSVKTLLWAKG